jgi:hypothetical protein
MNATTTAPVIKVTDAHRAQAALGTPGLNDAEPVFHARREAVLNLLQSSEVGSNYVDSLSQQPLSYVAFLIRQNAKLAANTEAPYYIRNPDSWAARAEALNALFADVEALIAAEAVAV